MSLITDALNQARDQHTRPSRETPPEQQGPNIPARPPGNRKPSGPSSDFVIIGLVIVCGILVVMLGGAVYFVYTSRSEEEQKEARDASEREQLAQDEAAEAPVGEPVADEHPPPSQETAVLPAETPPFVTIGSPASGTGKTTAPPEFQIDAPDEKPPPPAPEPDVKPATPRVQNEYRIGGIMKGDADRLAIVNGKVAGPGDVLSKGAEVIEVGERHVILKINDVKYKLSL